MTECFEESLWLPLSPEQVFSRVCDPRQLDSLTPEWIRFHVQTPSPIDLSEGSTVDYRLRWHGLPLHWQSRITDVDAPRRLAYEQAKGPYRRWWHDHILEPDRGGTLLIDRLEWQPPTRLVRPWIEREVRAIFDHRRKILETETTLKECHGN